MKRIALSLVAWAALAMPASAQNFLDLPSWQHWNLNLLSGDEQTKIQNGLKNGSLTPQEAQRLQDRLNKVNALKNKLSLGGLNMGEKVKIDNELDSLAQQIFRESNDSERSRWLGNKPWDWTRQARSNTNSGWNNNLPSWGHWNLDTMTTDEQARIRAGIANGSLTREEAQNLQDRLNRINSLKQQMSVGGLNNDERVRLDREIDKLAEKIYRQSNDSERSRWLGNQPWDWARNNNRPGNNANLDMPSWNHWNLNTMTDDEQARITAGLKNGRLTHSEGIALQNRLEQINQMKGRLSQGGLNPSERQMLDSQLDKLAADIYRESNDNDKSRWLGNQPWDWTHSRNGGWKQDKDDWKDNKAGWNGRNRPAGDNRMWMQGQPPSDRRDDTGNMTNKEVRNASQGYDQIQRQQDRMSADGLTGKEQRKLEKKKDRMERKVNRDRND